MTKKEKKQEQAKILRIHDRSAELGALPADPLIYCGEIRGHQWFNVSCSGPSCLEDGSATTVGLVWSLSGLKQGTRMRLDWYRQFRKSQG